MDVEVYSLAVTLGTHHPLAFSPLTQPISCALKTIQFFASNQNSVSEILGQRQPPKEGKKAKKGQ